MKNVFFKSLPILFLLVVVSSCKKEDLDFSKFSDDRKFERTIAMPLIYGDLYLSDFITSDSILILEGDSSFTDTIGLDLSSGDLANFELEFFDLYHSAKNYLPVGLNLWFVSYDSASAQNIDTFRFSDEKLYLPPAMLDNNGNVIESSVDSITGIMTIDNNVAENLLNRATHLIFELRLLSDTTAIIPVDDINRIWIKYGFHAKGTFYSF